MNPESHPSLFTRRYREGSAILENTLAFAIEDAYPVTTGHTLFIPFREVSGVFDLTSGEMSAIGSLIRLRREELERIDPSITGFNIGVNCGASAGQTVFHCHVHLIPRRDGDMVNPRGGVRGVIPERRIY